MAFEVSGNPGPNVKKIIDQYLIALTQEIQLITLEVARSAKQNLTDTGKVDRGFLRNSIDQEVTSKGGNIEGVTFAGSIHGPWVEFGRKGSKSSPTGTGQDSADAAFPPMDIIKDWVKRNNNKLAVSGRSKSGKAKRSKDSDLNRAAYLIAKKIYEHGIEPSPYLIPAFLEIRPFYRQRLIKTLQSVKLNLK